MNTDRNIKNQEKAVFNLRNLYADFGYSLYKMSKFEEYDLYAKNKDFLISENVITFTDTDGKLMALKPDVTLSIIKNTEDDGCGVQKVFYDENVYRVSKSTKSFKEIMQVGLECIGDVDEYGVFEVVLLAVKSLESISCEYVLDLSSLDVLDCVFKKANLSDKGRAQVIEYLSEKNVGAIESVCIAEGVSEQDANLLKTLVTAYGAPEKVQNALLALNPDEQTKSALNSLMKVVDGLKALGMADNVRIDFSVVNDMKYYNGLVFKGFISGIPSGILSGGQYDNLMTKMGKKSRAIGFAVYLDELSRLSDNEQKFDVDVAIEYGDSDVRKVSLLVASLIAGGERVLAQKKLNKNVKYKRLIKSTDKELE